MGLIVHSANIDSDWIIRKTVIFTQAQICRLESLVPGLRTRLDTDALIHLPAVYNNAGNVIETHEHPGEFREQKRC